MKYALGLFTCLFASAVFADVTINGEGKVTVEPDRAVVTVGVVTEDKKADEAVKKNAVAMKAVFKVLEDDLKIARGDLCTSDFGVHPKYKYVKDEEPFLVGYTARNTLTVTVRKVSELGKLLDTVVSVGANRVHGVEFVISDAEKFLDAARKAAAADALRKAKLYAKELGTEIDKVVSIVENERHIPRYGIRSLAAADSATPVSAGHRELRVSVQVVFSLKQAKPTGLKPRFPTGKRDKASSGAER